MAKGKSMKSPEGMVFIFSLAMLVFSFYMIFMKENTDFSASQLQIDDLKGKIGAQNQVQIQIVDDQKNFAAQTVKSMASLNEEMKKISGNQAQNLNLTVAFKEPLKVSLVYKKRELPAAPVVFEKSKAPSVTPLLNRAGIKKPLLNQ